jgi:hypothetical protein
MPTDRHFDITWIVPLEPGLATHVQLLDHDQDHAALAIGHGGDEADALMDLWLTLVARQEDDAARFVANAYVKRTGHQPGEEPRQD